MVEPGALPPRAAAATASGSWSPPRQALPTRLPLAQPKPIGCAHRGQGLRWSLPCARVGIEGRAQGALDPAGVPPVASRGPGASVVSVGFHRAVRLNRVHSTPHTTSDHDACAPIDSQQESAVQMLSLYNTCKIPTIMW